MPNDDMITVRIPHDLVEKLDSFIERGASSGKKTSRADAIRDAITEYLILHDPNHQRDLKGCMHIVVEIVANSLVGRPPVEITECAEGYHGAVDAGAAAAKYPNE